jgi:uncharacterized protein YprB with RNaseH-like and TPR domain
LTVILTIRLQEEVATEKEFLGIIVPKEKEDQVDDILDVLESYPGEVNVIVAINGKKFDTHMSVRRCEGLMVELKNFVKENDIIFFKKKV